MQGQHIAMKTFLAIELSKASAGVLVGYALRACNII